MTPTPTPVMTPTPSSMVQQQVQHQRAAQMHQLRQGPNGVNPTNHHSVLHQQAALAVRQSPLFLPRYGHLIDANSYFLLLLHKKGLPPQNQIFKGFFSKSTPRLGMCDKIEFIMTPFFCRGLGLEENEFFVRRASYHFKAWQRKHLPAFDFFFNY